MTKEMVVVDKNFTSSFRRTQYNSKRPRIGILIVATSWNSGH